MGKAIVFYRLVFAFLVVHLSTSVAESQIPATAGRSFVFSLPEDASNIGSATGVGRYVINILSPYAGTGTLSAPGGITINFDFKANIVTEFTLPRSLVHTRTTGKAPIGISVTTTTPVNLVLHNLLDFAGESTQIWPIESLGKEYIVGSWGIHNDQTEDNHAEITITPVTDETAVTITPSVNTLNGVAHDSTFTILLNHGDSYILKTDTSSGKAIGLAGTRIKATGPVSVMTAVTCAYVPLGSQACNLLLDHVLPFEYAGTEFYASPLGDTVREAYLVFTSTQKIFAVTLSDGRTLPSTTGRIVAEIGVPVRCKTSAPAFCHLLTPGVEHVLISDPSIVTILPTQCYQSSMMWSVPRMMNGGMPFYQTINIITPTSALASILLDEKPITSIASSAVIAGTDRSVIQAELQPGTHTLKSQEPLFAIASGFYTADAYSFIPMGVGFASKVSTPTGVTYDLPVSVRENPANRSLSLDVSGADSIELTIFNALGNTVLRLSGLAKDLATIDIASLPAGSYTLEVSAGTRLGRARFVISR